MGKDLQGVQAEGLFRIRNYSRVSIFSFVPYSSWAGGLLPVGPRRGSFTEVQSRPCRFEEGRVPEALAQMALALTLKGFAQFRDMAALLSRFGYLLERISLQTDRGRVDDEGINSIRRSPRSKQYRILAKPKIPDILEQIFGFEAANQMLRKSGHGFRGSLNPWANEAD